MSDDRRHRGAHPEDAELFAPAWHSRLRSATSDLSWLLTRQYATPSALKVVGDRYGLTVRQRTAVMRSACSDAARAARLAREVSLAEVGNRAIWIDGYNVLTTVEAALAGGVVIVGRDGCWRDMASMHGTWRRVDETPIALTKIGEALARSGAIDVTWYLDSPVSNSGRLKGVILEVARTRAWAWQVEVVPDPDKVLIASRNVVTASADSVVLDGCETWVSLARAVVTELPTVWRVDMADDAPLLM